MTGRSPLPDFYRLLRLDEVDSTNEEAKRQAQTGAAEGLVVWADSQTSGRGRRGRVWVSPKGNLYFSMLLRPQGSAGAVAQLGFAAALAVGEAALSLLPPETPLAYKWPNDVLLAGNKLAGILLESQAASDGKVDWLIVGIGVNLVSFPELTEYPATSLAAAGAEIIAPLTMLSAITTRFERWYECWNRDGFAPLRDAWLQRVQGLGEAIRVRLARSEMTGRFAGLDPAGALLIDTGQSVERVAAGDVFPAAG